MATNYIVTAHKPTAVNHCIAGSFTSPDELNLLIAKNNRLEIYLVTPEGPKPIKEVLIYGKIVCMQLFRPPGEDKDLLFILTLRYHVAILEFTNDGNGVIDIITRVSGNVQDRMGRPAETGPIAVVDPECRCIGFRLYDGLFKVFPLDSSMKEISAFNLRCEETSIIDMQFIYGFANPTICFIYQDHHGRHLKTYEISMKEKEFQKGPWKQEFIEVEASIVVAVPEPCCGVLVIGAESITYEKAEHFVSMAPPIIRKSQINCCSRIDPDGSRYLMGDMDGSLFMLTLERGDGVGDSNLVKELKVLHLGTISIPECITYLDNCTVFIGSKLGDSQLIRVNPDPNEDGSYVSVLETITNLGPIIDMCVVDLEKQGQDQLVTCSGYKKEGTLRIIRNGIGIQEHASIDLIGNKGIWALKVNGSAKDNVIALSFVAQTRALMLSDSGEVEEFDITGFDSDVASHVISNVVCRQILQATARSLRLVNDESFQLLCEWKPTFDRTLSKVTCTSEEVLACAGRDVFFLTLNSSSIELCGSTTLDHEPACLHLSPPNVRLCAVGLWTELSVVVFRLPDFEPLCKQLLGGEIIPRSIMLSSFENINYLLVAMGDGSLIYFTFDKDNLTLYDKKKVILGTQPTSLTSFISRNTTIVFACSDRPTVIYSTNQKLLFSNVNLLEVNQMTPLDSVAYPDSLALCNDSCLLIGGMDEIQKLHIRTVNLYESPSRIAYQEETQTFGVLSERIDELSSYGQLKANPQCASMTALCTTSNRNLPPPPQPDSVSPVARNPLPEAIVNSVLIFDQHTFEVLHCHELAINETGVSIASMLLGDDLTVYYVVGTAYIYPEDHEPKKGRLLIFSFSDGKLSLVHEKEIKGAPYSILQFNGKVLAAVNNMVQLFEWTKEKELQSDCAINNNIVALYLKVKGDFVLVGDLMKSISLLLYKQSEGCFEQIACDYNPMWTSAIEILDDDTFLGAEHCNNLYTCQKDTSATTEEDRKRLQVVGKYYLEDFVNVFKRGSLVMANATEMNHFLHPPVLFGTISGAIGLCVPLTNSLYTLLSQLVKKLIPKINSVGKVSYTDWRSFHTEFMTEPSVGFVDGDLIERFLDIPRGDANEVVSDIQLEDDDSGMKRMADVDYFIKLVEELSRIK